MKALSPLKLDSPRRLSLFVLVLTAGVLLATFSVGPAPQSSAEEAPATEAASLLLNQTSTSSAPLIKEAV